MVKHKNLLAVLAVVICLITVIWFSTTTQGRAKTYEIQPRVSVPEYKTDAARAIDAYERLMERFINTTDRSSIRIERDLAEVIKKLDSINNKLSRLSLRIERIEKTFGIEESKPQKNKKPRPEIFENKAPNESFPIW